MIKIIGFGAYIPMYRIKKEDYINMWGFFSGSIREKSVIGYDEDTLTMAVEAGANAIKNSNINKNDIKLVAIGSTTPPYAVKSMASEVAMALGIPLDGSLLDFRESEKAGTSALVAAIDTIRNRGGYGLIIASDAPLAAPGDTIEHLQSAAAAAIIIGADEDCIATIDGVKSSNVEFIADRFKKEGSKFVKDLEIASYSNFAYNKCINDATRNLLKDLNMNIQAFQHVFIQGQDSKQPLRVISDLKPDLIYTQSLELVGNCGAATALLGLIGILHFKTQVNDKILLVSYGSGAGSDAICLTVKKKQAKIKGILTIEQYLNRKEYINYEKYIKFKDLIELE